MLNPLPREHACKAALARVLVPLTAPWGGRHSPPWASGGGGAGTHDSPSLLCPSVLCKTLALFAKLHCIK